MCKMSAEFINQRVYENVGAMFLRLKSTESWRGKIPVQEGYFKEEAEGFKLLVLGIFAPIMLDENADLRALPAYLVKRLYRKAYTWDAKPDNMKWFRSQIPGFDAKLDDYVHGCLEAEGLKDFADYIWSEAEKLPDDVARVYKAARIFATLLEYEEMADKFRADTVEETRQQVYQELNQYRDLPHFSEIVDGLGEYSEVRKLLKSISASRYIFRWQGYICTVRCSIQAHMLEAAVLSYIMNLELGEATAEEMLHDFWVLMFHDLAEIWTDDVPSPVKDGFKINKPSRELVSKFNTEEVELRHLCEEQERLALGEHFYPFLPKSVVAFFKNGVMLEDVSDKEKKKFYKAADYFSADLEVWWMIKGGCREVRFKEIHKESLSPKRFRTPAQRAVLQKFVALCEQIVFFE